MFNETVTFLLSRPHVAARVENCFSAKFASILRMFRASEYSHTAKIALVLYMLSKCGDCCSGIVQCSWKDFRHVLSMQRVEH